MQLNELITELEKWAPPSYAEDFDNVGLLVGNPQQEINGVLVTLDCLEEVVEEAISLNLNCIVSFHPIIFKGLKSLTGKNYVERAVLKAVKNDIAIYAMHTNLDAVQTGVNAMISEKIGLKNTKILIPKSFSLNKLVTYIPSSLSEEKREAILKAMYEAGAGRIGNYSECSFQTKGKGTFTPNEAANPTIGTPLKPEKVEEDKVEVLVENHRLPKVLNALKKAHPYEEVAYEIYPIANKNQEVGMGMIGSFDAPMNELQFLHLLKERFNVGVIRHSAIVERKVRTVAVLGGSGSFAIADAKAQQADAYVSADFKYHDFFQAEKRILLADIGHYESEQFTKELIFQYITKKFPNFAVQISNINTNPIYYA